MNLMARRPSARDLISKIESQKGKIPIRGIVEIDANDDKSIKFSRSANCDNWISIPIDIISDVDFIGVVECKGHTHSFVLLTLNEPQSDEAKIYASLLVDGLPSQHASQGNVNNNTPIAASWLNAVSATHPSFEVAKDMSSHDNFAFNNAFSTMPGFGVKCGWVLDMNTGRKIWRCI